MKSKSKKTLLLVMVTTFGVKDNEYRDSLVQNEVTMKALLSWIIKPAAGEFKANSAAG